MMLLEHESRNITSQVSEEDAGYLLIKKKNKKTI
jgi:hypothetical protein